MFYQKDRNEQGGDSMESAIRYDVTDPLSIEKYAQQLIGKSFLDVVKEAEINEDIKVNIIDKYDKSKIKVAWGNFLKSTILGINLIAINKLIFMKLVLSLRFLHIKS